MPDEWTVQTLHEHWHQLREADQRALRLQADEYERRLSDLNGAHEKALQVQHTYLTIDKFEEFQRTNTATREVDVAALRDSLNSIEALLAVLTAEVRDTATRRRLVASIVAGVAAALTVAIGAAALLL